jgi:hypothetical protein
MATCAGFDAKPTNPNHTWLLGFGNATYFIQYVKREVLTASSEPMSIKTG